MMAFRWQCSVVIVTSLAVFSSCSAYNVEFRPALDAEEMAIVPAKSALTVIIESVETKIDGPFPPSFAAIDKELLTYRLQETNLFAAVRDRPMDGEEFLRLRLRLERNTETNMESLTGQAILVGFTLGLAAPLVEVEKRYTTHGQLEVIRSDGRRAEFERSMSGTATFQLLGEFAANAELQKADVRVITLLFHDVAASAIARQ